MFFFYLYMSSFKILHEFLLRNVEDIANKCDETSDIYFVNFHISCHIVLNFYPYKLIIAQYNSEAWSLIYAKHNVNTEVQTSLLDVAWTALRTLLTDRLDGNNRMACQWAETLVKIRETLANIRGTTK